MKAPSSLISSGSSFPHSRPRHIRQAFTLLELLVAISLLSVLVVLLMGLVDSATKLWRFNENRVETYREARSALALIAMDLASIYPSLDPQHFLLEEGRSDGLARLGFLAQLPSSSQETTDLSGLCAVGFFLAKGRVSDIGPDSTAQGWNLYRYLLGSNETFTALRDTPGDPELFPDSAFQPREIADPPRTEILARNIQHFRVRPLRREGSDFTDWTYSAETPLPDVLEIELVGLDNDAARRANGDIRDETVAPGDVRTWVTRVALPRRPPVSSTPVAAASSP